MYLPRSYDGSTWKVLEKPITNISKIQEINMASKRDEAIAAFINDAKSEVLNGNVVIYGGDNNEPSHLDWVEANKDLYDHHGVVMPWFNTVQLDKAGFLDAYRTVFSNPITHPGFTYPANNTAVPVTKLAWSPNADDRDRIDFIFYYPDTRLKLENVAILGPRGDIVRNKRVIENTADNIITPKNIWPSDHKAVLAVFKLNI
ncbi:endonuclease/exonuclease/phosphatase [Formosa agariphila KMM 3901]|uniref:Endonuclease/exonuclease/phosphatase n=1 Tax=Formosa agariphila (strain DSM 15362 / KCTC 12365 / LMG 23005 / KMM 3901 / M-2Alg 35-1) TaxID=1347342 RepID=T2KQT5_FORAG|nr:endonuclease/exonuclease/phosphatase [Formosa agariphila KMM 3901]